MIGRATGQQSSRGARAAAVLAGVGAVALVGGKTVAPGAAVDVVGRAVIGVDRVGTGVADHEVGAAAADEGIGSGCAEDRVGAGAAEKTETEAGQRRGRS